MRVIGAYRAAWPHWGRLLVVHWAYWAFVMAIGLVLTLLARWYDPSLWQGSEGLALFGNQWAFYLLILMTFYTPDPGARRLYPSPGLDPQSAASERRGG